MTLPGREFLGMIFRALTLVIRRETKLALSILLADGLWVATRMGALGAVSAIAYILNGDGSLTIGSFKYIAPDDPWQLGLLAAVSLSSVVFVAALAKYLGAWLSRRLAHRMNERFIDRVVAAFATSPSRSVAVDPIHPDELPRMLTQNGFHYGMFCETLLRMFSPMALFVLAFAVVASLSFWVAGAIVGFVLLASPLYIRAFTRTVKVASSFYSDQAARMGGSVAGLISLLTSQFGIMRPTKDALDLNHNPDMERFLDAFDDNILANERIDLLMGVLGAVFVGILAALSLPMIETGQFSAAGVIALLGSFIFLVSSGRTLMGMGVNLLRFYPQIRYALDLTNTVQQEPEYDGGPLPDSITVTASQEGSPVPYLILKPGAEERLALLYPQMLSKFTLAPVLTALSSGDPQLRATLAKHVRFLSHRYRYAPGRTVSSHLGLGEGDDDRILELAEFLGARSDYEALPDGFDTPMSEAMYQSLGGEARTSLGLLPLMREQGPRLVLIDAVAIQNLNPLTFAGIFEKMPEAIIVIVLADNNCPDNMAHVFARLKDGTVTSIGGREWMTGQTLNTTASGGDLSTTIGMATI